MFTFEDDEEELKNCIRSFINFLEGKKFQIKGFTEQVFIKIIDEMEITGFDELLSQLIPIPSTFEGSVTFLKYSFASRFEEYFQKSVEIVSSQFYLFQEENLPQFDFIVFKHIFGSTCLKVQNETVFLNILLKLIKKDKNFIFSLKSVQFNFVQSEVLKQFLSQIQIAEVDLELFENIKQSLVQSQNPILDKSRWIEEPNVLSREETSKIVQTIENLCHSKTNLSERLKDFICKQKYYEEVIENNQAEIQLFKLQFLQQSQETQSRMSNIEKQMNKIESVLNIFVEQNQSIKNGI
jgi:hypothetical protein